MGIKLPGLKVVVNVEVGLRAVIAPGATDIMEHLLGTQTICFSSSRKHLNPCCQSAPEPFEAPLETHGLLRTPGLFVLG